MIRNLRLCLPLNEARELFVSERNVFRWARGPGGNGNNDCCLISNSSAWIVPLMIIFTKRDGAVTKVTAEIIAQAIEGTTRKVRREARSKAENDVDIDVKRREEELREMIDDMSVGFLTMSGMFVQSMEIKNRY